MEATFKAGIRKRSIVGWRQAARRVAENRSRQRPPPPPQSKREA